MKDQITFREWIERREIQRHDVAVIVMDRTTGEGVLTTVAPKFVADVADIEKTAFITLDQTG